MMEPVTNFDLAIVGGGPAGYVAAAEAGKAGLKVALIEQDKNLGGTCLNRGCIPSKVLLEARDFMRPAFYEESTLAWQMSRKEAIIAKLAEGINQLMLSRGITIFTGRAFLQKDGSLLCKNGDNTEQISADKIILAPGSKEAELPFAPFDHRYIVSSTDALSFGKAPHKLVIIGGGAIGLELGRVWQFFGSQVTILEMLPQIAGLDDKQIAVLFERALKKRGLDIYTGAKVLKIAVRRETTAMGEGYEAAFVQCELSGEVTEFLADKVLVAVGRRPNTTDMGLIEAGVQLDERGYIVVDENYATTKAGIYAIGDAIKGPMLAHKAETEARVLIAKLINKNAKVQVSNIPAVIYTEPELATVGLSEAKAKKLGLKTVCGKSYFAANGRAQSMMGLQNGQPLAADGLVKVVTKAETKEIIGVQIFGPHASELIAEATILVDKKMTAHEVKYTCHAHPTLAEALHDACENIV